LEVERAPRDVRIDVLDIVEFCGEKLVISVKCSKGTYIRTLAEELGSRLGCGAYLTGLRRTGSGRFNIADAATLEKLAEIGPEASRGRLLPVDVLVESLPHLPLDERAAWAIRNGQEIAADPSWPAGEGAVYGPDNILIGVGVVDAGRLSAARLLATNRSG
jgi:tRNA pseudouridine55 synthase